MDEVLFHVSEKLETLQVQVSLGGQRGRAALAELVERVQALGLALAASPQAAAIVAAVTQAAERAALATTQVRDTVAEATQQLYAQVLSQLAHDGARAGVVCGCVGLAVGISVGISVGLSWRRNPTCPPRVKAVVCTSYDGVDALCLVEDFPAPSISRPDEVLIRVKAASVDPIDLRICSGYGHLLRYQLNRRNKNVPGLFPVLLGRDCAGVVLETGVRVTRVLPGDEVWLSRSPWATGTLAELIVVREDQVFRKPRAVGFETAAALPFAGQAAWDAFHHQAKLTNACTGKRVLVRDAVSPVGCVLLQLSRLNGAHVTATCRLRATPVAQALGADLVLATEAQDALAQAQPFHVVFHTHGTCATEECHRLCIEGGIVVDATAPRIRSDGFSFPISTLYAMFVRIRSLFMTDAASHWHSSGSSSSLDALCLLVEDGSLQPVVDKIYAPRDAELAFQHVGSADAIGKTVIRFRTRNFDKSRSSSQCKKPDDSSST